MLRVPCYVLRFMFEVLRVSTRHVSVLHLRACRNAIAFWLREKLGLLQRRKCNCDDDYDNNNYNNAEDYDRNDDDDIDDDDSSGGDGGGGSCD